MATRVGGLHVVLTGNVAKFAKSMDKAYAKTKKLRHQIGQTSKKIATYGTVAVGAAVAGTAAMVRANLRLIDSTAKTADKLGIQIDALQRLRFAAEQTGVEANVLDTAIQRMTRRVAEAAQGSGEAAGALKELGLDAQALAAMSPDEQFRAIAGAMGNVSSQGDRVRLAMRLFDTEGVALVNTLALGEDGLARMGAQADELGITLDRVSAQKVENANDAINRAQKAIGGVAQRVTVALAPIIEQVANYVTAFLGRFNTSSDRVLGVVRAIAVGAGHVADALKYVVAGFKGIELVGNLAAQGIIERFIAILGVVEKVSNALGVDSEFVSNAKKGAEELRAAYSARLDEIAAETRAIVNTNISKEVAEGFDKLQRAAQAASGAAVEEKKAAMDLAAVSDQKLDQLEKERKLLEKLKSEAERVREATRTPLEKFEEDIEKLRELLAKDLIDEETFRRAVEQAEKRRDQALERENPTERNNAREALFKQVRLDRIALGGAGGVGRRPQEVRSTQIDKTNRLLEDVRDALDRRRREGLVLA